MRLNPTSPFNRCVAILLICLMIPSIGLLAQQADQPKQEKKDYYYEGLYTAQKEYEGGGAMLGGIAAGTLLGLIGWGVGALIVANADVDVPYHHIADLDIKDRLDFEAGYKKYVKKKRNGRFNVGAGIGTAIAIVIVSATMSE